MPRGIEMVAIISTICVRVSVHSPVRPIFRATALDSSRLDRYNVQIEIRINLGFENDIAQVYGIRWLAANGERRTEREGGGGEWLERSPRRVKVSTTEMNLTGLAGPHPIPSDIWTILGHVDLPFVDVW